MDELLQVLERRIRALISQFDQTKSTTSQLRQSNYLAVHEKDLLLARQQKAIQQIENLVSKLKTLEKMT